LRAREVEAALTDGFEVAKQKAVGEAEGGAGLERREYLLILGHARGVRNEAQHLV
jgi:hypothetical protein